MIISVSSPQSPSAPAVLTLASHLVFLFSFLSLSLYTHTHTHPSKPTSSLTPKPQTPVFFPILTMALCHFLLYLLYTYTFLPFCYCFPMPTLNTVHPSTCLSYLLLLCHFPMIHPYCSLITFCFIASTFFLSPLLPPTRPSTYPYVD